MSVNNFFQSFQPHHSLHCVWVVLRLEKQTLLYFWPGWLWSRPAHLSTVCTVLSRGPEAVLSRGIWNWCCDLHSGNWVLFFFNINRKDGRMDACVWTFSQFSVRRSPRNPSRGSLCTTSQRGNTTRRSMRPTTGAYRAKSRRTWRRFVASRVK